MSEFGASFGVDAVDAGVGSSSRSMCASVEVGGTLPVVEPVASYIAPPVSPYPTIVDPFKRRTALREYFRGLRGENKENERAEGDVKSPLTSVPKQKTLGLCRRHLVPTTTIAAVAGDGMLRDKRKFNAPRQTPEKRQRPVESDLAEVPRRLDVVNQLVVEEDASGDVSQPLVQFASRELVELEPAMGQVPFRNEAEIRRPQMVFATARDVSSSINRQSQDSQFLSFKRQLQEPKSPAIRKPLAPVNMNRQAIHVHSSPMPLKPNFSGGMEQREGMECEGSVASESLFQLASGKRYQPSAAAKARAASLFESDAELADLLGFE